MWWSELRRLAHPFRAALALLLFAALAGCGFSPALAPAGPAGGLYGAVQPDPPASRDGFDFVGRLERRLGHASDPRYRLAYRITTRREGVGVTPGQEIIRYNVYGTLNYDLHELASGKVVDSGTVEAFTSYSVGLVDTGVSPATGTNAVIASEAAERDAYRRLMAALADQTATRLMLREGGARR